ncbi:MAG: LysM domain-containing protein, partial [Chloroflexota bacterium]
MSKQFGRIIAFFAILLISGISGLSYAQSTCGPTVTVRTGETLSTIAAACNTSIGELIRLNPGSESQIEAGEVLLLPTYDVAQQPPFIAVTPLSGAPGQSLDVIVNGFPPYTELRLRLGSTVTETVETRRVITTADGAVVTEMAIPVNAAVGTRFVLIAESTDGRINARSYPVEVTFGGGRLFNETTIYLIALGDAGERGLGIGCRDRLVAV